LFKFRIPQSAIRNLIGDLAAGLFEIGNRVKDRILVSGIPVSVDPKGPLLFADVLYLL
jgi:hypothetical protein